jgi:hypothetical protein
MRSPRSSVSSNLVNDVIRTGDYRSSLGRTRIISVHAMDDFHSQAW